MPDTSMPDTTMPNKQSRKKLLAISTSPRINGNSESALDLFISKMSDTFETEKFRASDLKISPCIGCGFCEKKGVCIQKDDFTELLEKMLASDVVVFASPVYALSLPAQAKVIVDRCQVLWARKYILHTQVKSPDKRGVFIATAAQESERIFDNTIPVARFLFDGLGVREKNMQYVLLSGLEKKTEFSKSVEAQKKVEEEAMRLFGLMLV